MDGYTISNFSTVASDDHGLARGFLARVPSNGSTQCHHFRILVHSSPTLFVHSPWVGRDVQLQRSAGVSRSAIGDFFHSFVNVFITSRRTDSLLSITLSFFRGNVPDRKGFLVFRNAVLSSFLDPRLVPSIRSISVHRLHRVDPFLRNEVSTTSRN